jgi:hypothetical protein
LLQPREGFTGNIYSTNIYFLNVNNTPGIGLAMGRWSCEERQTGSLPSEVRGM